MPGGRNRRRQRGAAAPEVEGDDVQSGAAAPELEGDDIENPLLAHHTEPLPTAGPVSSHAFFHLWGGIFFAVPLHRVDLVHAADPYFILLLRAVIGWLEAQAQSA